MNSPLLYELLTLAILPCLPLDGGTLSSFYLGMSRIPPCLCKMPNGIQEITLSLLIKEITSKGQISKIL